MAFVNDVDATEPPAFPTNRTLYSEAIDAKDVPPVPVTGRSFSAAALRVREKRDGLQDTLINPWMFPC